GQLLHRLQHAVLLQLRVQHPVLLQRLGLRLLARAVRHLPASVSAPRRCARTFRPRGILLLTAGRLPVCPFTIRSPFAAQFPICTPCPASGPSHRIGGGVWFQDGFPFPEESTMKKSLLLVAVAALAVVLALGNNAFAQNKDGVKQEDKTTDKDKEKTPETVKTMPTVVPGIIYLSPSGQPMYVYPFPGSSMMPGTMTYPQYSYGMQGT